jgi:L-threonylcarbamoyladenylate synthase
VLATGSQPVILRPGAITAADIQRITGVDVSEATTDAPRVSGALDSHYSPTAQVILINNVSEAGLESDAGFLALAQLPTPAGLVRLASPETIEDFAHELYGSLRAGDDLKLKTIYVIPPTGDGLAQAINDRLQRAAF